jgi:hypothetical protein
MDKKHLRMGGLKALPFPYKKVCKKEGTVENQDEKEFSAI